MWGAQAVWVGTRFVAATEASAPPKHKELILTAGYDDVEKTLIYVSTWSSSSPSCNHAVGSYLRAIRFHLMQTGRPLRVRYTPYVRDWNENRAAEIKELTTKGVLPHEKELESHPEKSLEGR